MSQRPKEENIKTIHIHWNIMRKKIYKVIFRNTRKIERTVKVNEEIFEAFNKFELDDLSKMNEYDNHIEHSQIFENNLYSRALNKPISVEEMVDKKMLDELVKNAISELSNIQKRRIIKYYFDNKTESEIASEENATQQSVHISLERAREKLKGILKKIKNLVCYFSVFLGNK